MKKFLSIIAFLSVFLLAVSHYPEDLIAKAKERRENWWKEQEHERFAVKKRNYFRYIERLVRKPSLRATDPQDKEVLERFYTSTVGERWANNSGWMKGDPCMNYWYGIYCSDSGKVLEINLAYNLLSGSLPVDLGLLDQLQALRLYSNDIKGTLPAGLFSLNSLQELDLDDNEIGGSLPGAVTMANVTIINLYQNNLYGNIPQVWNTPKLTTLSISSNMFEGKLPPSIGRISTLEVFVASRNTLTGVFPEEYGELKNLQQLWLFSNNFDRPHIPLSWSGMTSLTNVELDGIAGEFPDFIGNSWTSLTNLVIVDGFATGNFPTSLCRLKHIQYLHIYNNSLRGELPNCICDLPPCLLNLELSDNQFTGTIPDCLGNLRNLTNLFLSRNNLSGRLPRTLGQCKLLEIMDVSTNGIYGPVPSTYANLNGVLVDLALCYNKLSSLEEGLESLLDFVKGYQCLLYNNPWVCPLPAYVPKECQATCSPCNSGEQHTSCSACITNDQCGWCDEGGNCLEGSANGPGNYYPCNKTEWTYGKTTHCPNINYQ